MRRFFFALPGPLPVRIAISLVLVAILLVALHFVYEWMGTTLLDTGGTLG